MIVSSILMILGGVVIWMGYHISRAIQYGLGIAEEDDE